MRCNRSSWLEGDRADDGMALPVDLERLLRHPDDAPLDRLLESAAAEARGRDRTDTRKPATEARRKLASVTLGQERLVVAAHEAGLGPVAIAGVPAVACPGGGRGGRRKAAAAVNGPATVPG